MKKFKVFDVWVNVVLILGAFIFGIIVQNGNFIIGYFVVGVWQIISMIVHAIANCFVHKGGIRYYFDSTVVIIIVIAFLSFWIYPLLYIYPVLLILSPFMALFYTHICYEETYIKMKRPLDDLK